MTRMTLADIIRRNAEGLGQAYGVPPERIQAILVRIIRTRYKKGEPLGVHYNGFHPEIELSPSITMAILSAGPTRALQFFESCEDFNDLHQREFCVMDWAVSHSLLFDRPGLCQILDNFIRDQRDGRDYLVLTGYPPAAAQIPPPVATPNSPTLS